MDDTENRKYIEHFFIMLKECVDHYNDGDDVDKQLFYNGLMERLTTDINAEKLRSYNIEDERKGNPY